MEKNQILAESWSPSCPIQAFVEQDARTCYFYLWENPGEPRAKVKSCFVCNVAGRESQVPLREWKSKGDGSPPMLPYDQVTHSDKGLILEKQELEIVWTKEGSGAGLFWKGKLIAFIPEWADERFPGFCRFVRGQTPFGVEMTQAAERLEKTMAEARAFWRALEGDFWPSFQQSHLDSIQAYLGGTDRYYAIDGGKFPPKALVTGERDGVLYGITLGVSILRQPQVEAFYQDKTADFSRIELGFACRKEQEAVFLPVLERLSGAASLPWRAITSLGHGHTITCDAVEGFSAIWLLNANLLPAGCSPVYQPAFGERVNLLWAVLVTQEEYRFLLKYDMEKIFRLSFDREIAVFDGRPKVPVELLSSLGGGSLIKQNK